MKRLTLLLSASALAVVLLAVVPIGGASDRRAAGTQIFYAVINADGTVQKQRVEGVNLKVTHPATGVYCLRTTLSPARVVATATTPSDGTQGAPVYGASWLPGVTAKGCPAGSLTFMTYRLVASARPLPASAGQVGSAVTSVPFDRPLVVNGSA